MRRILITRALNIQRKVLNREQDNILTTITEAMDDKNYNQT
jgi:hypothetical protein